MSVFSSLRAAALALLLILLIGYADPAIANTENATDGLPQNRALLSALVALGGGPDRFNAAMFRKALETGDEEHRLSEALGAATIERFDKVFSFVVTDGISTMKRQGITLPKAAPNPKDSKAVATALYRAGLHDGVFNIERLFDVLFSSSVHMHAMMAVGRMYGEPGETAYHSVLARLLSDSQSHP
jgi:hypothetical protein